LKLFLVRSMASRISFSTSASSVTVVLMKAS
jgi:hypothetical protein